MYQGSFVCVVYNTYTYANIKHRRLCCSGTNGFINFWLRSFDTRRETQFLKVFRDHTMLTTPQHATHLVVQSEFLNTMVGPQLLNIIVGLQLLHTMVGTQLLHTMVGTQLLFSKILQILSPSLPGMTSSTLQSRFLSGAYYDNGDCHILCARA